MPTILTAVEKDGQRSVVMTNTNPDAITGRWAKAPLVPDLCYTCFDENLSHYPAEGYREESDQDGVVWRHGTCHRCTEETLP